MRFKKFLLILPIILSACANTEDITLDKLVFGHEVRPDNTTLEEMIFGKECKNCRKKAVNKNGKIEYVNVEYIDETGAIYRLPTRANRYYNNEPTPEIYAVAATRAVNKMLDETENLYGDNATSFIYIADIQKADRQMPDGVYNAAKITQKTIRNSQTFKVVDNKNEADFILKSVIDNAGTPEEPILVYKLILFDTDNNKSGEWVETLRPIRNDDGSWW